MHDPENAVIVTCALGVIVARNFIVVEPDPIVRMDIEGMLLAEYPASQLATGDSLSEVGAALNSCGVETTLIVRGSLISENEDLLRVLRAAATRGSHLVVIGDMEDFDLPATFLELPFTTEMVVAAVAPGANQDGIRPDL